MRAPILLHAVAGMVKGQSRQKCLRCGMMLQTERLPLPLRAGDRIASRILNGEVEFSTLDPAVIGRGELNGWPIEACAPAVLGLAPKDVIRAGGANGCRCGDTVAEEADTQAMLAAEADRRGDAVESSVRKRVVTVLRWLASRLPPPGCAQAPTRPVARKATSIAPHRSALAAFKLVSHLLESALRDQGMLAKECKRLAEENDALGDENRRLRANGNRLGCARCGGPHPFDTSIPNDTWNRVMRPDGKEGDSEHLCSTCILAAFARAGESFTATLWSDELDGVPIEMRVRSQEANAAHALSEQLATCQSDLGRIREGVACAIRAETCTVRDGALVYDSGHTHRLIALAARIESGEIPNPEAWGLDAAAKPPACSSPPRWWQRLWRWVWPSAAGVVVASLIHTAMAHAHPLVPLEFYSRWAEADCRGAVCRIDDECVCQDSWTLSLSMCPCPTPTRQTITLEPPLCGRIDRPGTLHIDFIHCTAEGECGCGHPVDRPATPTPTPKVCP